MDIDFRFIFLCLGAFCMLWPVTYQIIGIMNMGDGHQTETIRKVYSDVETTTDRWVVDVMCAAVDHQWHIGLVGTVITTFLLVTWQ